MSVQSAFNFLTAEQLKRLRVWRIAYFVWRRRFRPWLICRYSQGIRRLSHRPNRRLWLSVLLFAGALGLTLWIDIARIRLDPDAQAVNPTPEVSAPLPTPSPSVVPQNSIDRFQEFSTPAVRKSITPIPDKLPPTETAQQPSPKASGNTPHPSANPRPTVTPATSPVVSPVVSPGNPTPNSPTPTATPAPIRPPYEVAWAHPSNYGDRFPKDINQKPLTQAPIIVLHETVFSADSAINYFQTPHSNEDDQASYHTLIRLNGTIIYIVPPEKRAFGAGNSVFVGKNGSESAKTHAQYAPSVNNFAYHISLETPIDGENDNETHSGYTEAQYRSLVWLVAQSTVPDDRITTHRAIDRSQSRIDPRSFDTQYFLALLHEQRSTSAKPTP